MEMTNRLMWRLFWIILICWILLIIGVSWATWSNATSDKLIETIKMIFIVVGGLGIVLPAFFSGWSTIQSSNMASNDNKKKLIENSYDLITAWDDPSLLDARDYTRNMKKRIPDISANDLLREIEEDVGLQRSLALVFNFWEKVRISIKYGRVDSSLIEHQLGEIYLDMCQRFKPWIDKRSSEGIADIEELKTFFKS
jgi:hypothetical protein